MRHWFVALALGASLLLCGPVLWAIGDAITYCRAVALGDLDADGDLDAFLANGRSEGRESNTVWLNDGSGRFGNSGQRLGEADSHSVALGDLDADGDLDVLVGDSPSCKVFVNDGRAGFVAQQWLPHPGDSGAYKWSVATGDLDGDGDLDAFAAGCCGATRTGASGAKTLYSYNMVWLNDGTGNLKDSGQQLGSLGSQDVALGDLDGDGDLDAFVVNSDGYNAVWLNDGRGHFVDNGQVLGYSIGHAVDLGDVDSDGDLDAFVGNNGANEVWLNDGGVQGGTPGNFVDSGQALGNSYARVVSLADLDSDGDLDAFVGNQRSLQTWLNDGGVQGGTPGRFDPGRQTLQHSTYRATALGDVDGDGDPDIIVGRAGGPLKVWLNDGTGHFGQRGLSRAVVYGAIGSVILAVIVLSVLGWWVVRRSIAGSKNG